MFPFSPGRTLFNLSILLFSLLILSGCKSDRSYVASDPTQVSIVDFSGTDPDIIGRLDSSLNDLQLPGTNEPFFSSVEIRPLNREKIPETPNLFLLISTATLKTDTALGGIFSKDIRTKAIGSDEAIFIKRENLFHEGQIVWLLLYHSNEGLQRFLEKRLASATATMMSTNINRIMSRDVSGSKHERGLSDALKNEWGLDLRLPEGFENIDSIPVENAFFRKGADTKTEEWILVSDISGKDSLAIDSLRDGVTGRIIRYQDGSRMKTVASFNYLGRQGYYRGSWETSPYPMAGLFTARILKKGNKTIYIEAGIYSPGRNKTLNLLRLEKLLRDL